MEKGLFNIASASTTELIPIHNKTGGISSINMTNTHDSIAVTVDLFLIDKLNVKCRIVKTDIPGKTTLLLSDNLAFNNSTLGLKITASGAGLSPSNYLSVIIK
tara:strand:- start:708 stop:1016 length:309 start_codon:yes stop_codon:yes gene_type:complete